MKIDDFLKSKEITNSDLMEHFELEREMKLDFAHHDGRCAACGDCVLGETSGFCPISRCAKSLMNGPCGGTRKDGRCEINDETDCVWNLIVERAEERGQLEDLAAVRKTKDWSNSSHGGPKKVIREDMQR